MKKRILFVPFLVLFVASACHMIVPTPTSQPSQLGMATATSLSSPSQEAEGLEESPLAPEEPSGEKPEYSGQFVEADCTCADYQPSKILPWGNASLDCRYDWSGPNIDQNYLGFSIAHFYHTEDLAPGFQERVDGLSTSLPSQVEGDHQGRQLRNDDEGYAFLVYGPGGGGKQGDIPLCGNGRGVYQTAGEFLIETDLFTCDLPYSDNAYVSAMTDMETCALRAIERIGK